MPNWFAPTHHDYLVANAGLDPATVLYVDCACGITNRRADYMIDVTGLPAAVRTALGIAEVDYLCDGCTTRLFREQHILQADFNALLGAPPDNVAMVQGFDDEHARGIAARPAHRRPKHTPVNPHSGQGGAPLPLQRRTLTHADAVAKLRQRGHLPPATPALPLPPGPRGPTP